MNNEQKIGLTTTELVLSIVGIVIFACLIILPPVFRVAFKEDEPEEEVIDEIQIKTLICNKDNYVSEGTMNNDIITITYYNDKPRTYNIKLEKTYDALETYDDEKQALGRLSTAYSLIDGISFSVNANDSDLRIVTTEECDLGLFKPTSVTLPGDSEETRIYSTYTNTDSIDEIKSNLTSAGYTCK